MSALPTGPIRVKLHDINPLFQLSERETTESVTAVLRVLQDIEFEREHLDRFGYGVHLILYVLQKTIELNAQLGGADRNVEIEIPIRAPEKPRGKVQAYVIETEE